MALDEAFDVNTLHELRKAVLAEAIAAGMPHDRAIDVMLAMHELAANAVCHGGGAGRARVRAADRELQCQVSDAGPGSVNAEADGGGAPVGQRGWAVRSGHGLWLVREAADRVSVAADFGGSCVTAMFALPGAAYPTRRPAE